MVVSRRASVANVVAGRISAARIRRAVLVPERGKTDLAREVSKRRQTPRFGEVGSPEIHEQARIIPGRTGRDQVQRALRLAGQEQTNGNPYRNALRMRSQAFVDD